MVRARSSVGEHYVEIAGVAGSIPAAPTIFLKGLTITPSRTMVLQLVLPRAVEHARPIRQVCVQRGPRCPEVRRIEPRSRLLSARCDRRAALWPGSPGIS